MTSAFILLLSIATFGQSTENTERKKIQETADRFSQAYVKGEYQTMASIYTEDAVLMSPGQDMIYGREAIYKFWSRDSTYHQTYHKSTSDKLEVVGDFAFDNGYWYSEATSGGKQWPLASGKYLIIWKRDDKGEWKMYHDIWNNRARNWQKEEDK